MIVGIDQSPSLEPQVTNKPKPSANPVTSPAPTPTPTSDAKTESKQKVAELIAKLYIQKSKYLGKLDEIEAYVVYQYDYVMTREEKKVAKQKFLTEYLPMVASWEKECDAVVGGIISEIRTALKESGQDTTIADTLDEAYKNEKKSKKAYFINRYMD